MTDSDPNNPGRDEPSDDPREKMGSGPRSRLHYLRRFHRRERDEDKREARRLRIRRHGRRAYIRSVYSLPSLATLGNAICGFGAMYIAASDLNIADHWTRFVSTRFDAAAYLIFFAMFFDAIDGRLARFTRHTTDFGGQLDSLADVVSFGCAPAFIALELFHATLNPHFGLNRLLSRLVWVIGALYMSCAAIRLARFNVSNEHGEQHHFSFLGLPSPGAGAAVAAFILMQQDLAERAHEYPIAGHLATACVIVLPLLVLVSGLLMVSTIRYPHLVNRYLRGRRSIGRVLAVLVTVLLMVSVHRYTLGIGALAYVFWGLTASSYRRVKPKREGGTERRRDGEKARDGGTEGAAT